MRLQSDLKETLYVSMSLCVTASVSRHNWGFKHPSSIPASTLPSYHIPSSSASPNCPREACFGGNVGVADPEVSLPAHVAEFPGLRSLQRKDACTCQKATNRVKNQTNKMEKEAYPRFCNLMPKASTYCITLFGFASVFLICEKIIWKLKWRLP